MKQFFCFGILFGFETPNEMKTTPRIQLDESLPEVYDDLRRFASGALVKERDRHSNAGFRVARNATPVKGE